MTDDSPARSVTQITQNSLPAWQSQGLENLAGQAKGLAGTPFEYFPGDTFTQLPPETLAGLDITTQRATEGNPALAAAQGYGADVIGGGYLDANPYVDQLVDAASRDVTRQYQEAIAPSILAQAEMAGQSGSPQAQSMLGQSQRELATTLGDISAQIRAPIYQQERALQQQMAGMAPELAQAAYIDPTALLGVGDVRREQAEAELADEMNRFEFGQREPWERLGLQQQFYTGNFGGTSSFTQPYYRNPAAGALGGALGGAGVGGQFGGPWGAGAGALLGGILGAI